VWPGPGRAGRPGPVSWPAPPGCRGGVLDVGGEAAQQGDRGIAERARRDTAAGEHLDELLGPPDRAEVRRWPASPGAATVARRRARVADTAAPSASGRPGHGRPRPVLAWPGGCGPAPVVT